MARFLPSMRPSTFLTPLVASAVVAGALALCAAPSTAHAAEPSDGKPADPSRVDAKPTVGVNNMETRPAGPQKPAGPEEAGASAATMNPFACRGEALALMAGLSTSDIEEERDKRITAPDDPGESAASRANRYCVIGLIMSRIGDTRAESYLQKAIETNPSEGGLELWAGHYMGSVRGPRYPVLEKAENHYYEGLKKLRARREAGHEQDFDAATTEWTQRKLLELYQEDGLPLLPWKAFPYRNDSPNAPGLFLTLQGRGSSDTNDFVDVSDVRKFTSEAMMSESSDRLNRGLTPTEASAIARAPLRYELTARARFRQRHIGAIDFSYRRLTLRNAQITRFVQPDVFSSATVTEIGANYRRPIDLYPLFDLMVEGGYRRVIRQGIVEYQPDQKEDIDLVELKPAISRFIGPDKLTLGMNLVYMGIQPLSAGPLYERHRERLIKAFYFDYAIYRPLLLPKFRHGSVVLRRSDTRGFHVFGGIALDDEQFGTRVIRRHDFYLGTSLKGLGAWDFTLQGTVFRGGVRTVAGDIEELSNMQYRTTVVLLRRLIDSDATPDIPEGVKPAMLNLVIPIKHDVALQGMNKYENVRVGVELWTRAIATGLRGPSFLVSAGYHFEYFYRLKENPDDTFGKGVHIGRLDIGMGF